MRWRLEDYVGKEECGKGWAMEKQQPLAGRPNGAERNVPVIFFTLGVAEPNYVQILTHTSVLALSVTVPPHHLPSPLWFFSKLGRLVICFFLLIVIFVLRPLISRSFAAAPSWTAHLLADICSFSSLDSNTHMYICIHMYVCTKIFYWCVL